MDAYVATLGNEVSHPQIVTDGAKQIVVFMKDDNPNQEPGGERVYAIERCGTGAWSAPELLRTPNGTAETQSIQYGRPSIAIDRGSNIVHVALTELDLLASPPAAEAWWVHKVYAECP